MFRVFERKFKSSKKGEKFLKICGKVLCFFLYTFLFCVENLFQNLFTWDLTKPSTSMIQIRKEVSFLFLFSFLFYFSLPSDVFVIYLAAKKILCCNGMRTFEEFIYLDVVMVFLFPELDDSS